jgi:hypothetical protein
MGDFVYQRNKKPVFVKAGIYRYLVVTAGITTVVAMAGNTLVYNFKIYPIMLYQLKRSVEGMFRQVWG